MTSAPKSARNAVPQGSTCTCSKESTRMPCKTVLSPIAISSQRAVLGSGSRPERHLESGEHCCPRGTGTTIHAQRTPRTRPMQASDHGAVLWDEGDYVPHGAYGVAEEGSPPGRLP